MPDAARERATGFESAFPAELSGLRAALVIAHPGHELRLHGWLEAARPDVLVLTDGAGRTSRSRLASTAEVLARSGARSGPVFGRFTDRALYEALLGGDTPTFAALAQELAATLRAADYVVADAAEGYNPAHDLCRLVVDAAVRLTGRPLRSFEFPLVGPPDRRRPGMSGRARVVLDDAALARKLAAADTYGELTGEVAAAVGENGRDAFRIEALDPSAPEAELAEPPYYERYGEQQVRRGFYRRILRYREHVLPVAEALRRLGPT